VVSNAVGSDAMGGGRWISNPSELRGIKLSVGGGTVT
jgi:hypothetical protein